MELFLNKCTVSIPCVCALDVDQNVYENSEMPSVRSKHAHPKRWYGIGTSVCNSVKSLRNGLQILRIKTLFLLSLSCQSPPVCQIAKISFSCNFN